MYYEMGRMFQKQTSELTRIHGSLPASEGFGGNEKGLIRERTSETTVSYPLPFSGVLDSPDNRIAQRDTTRLPRAPPTGAGRPRRDWASPAATPRCCGTKSQCVSPNRAPRTRPGRWQPQHAWLRNAATNGFEGRLGMKRLTIPPFGGRHAETPAVGPIEV